MKQSFGICEWSFPVSGTLAIQLAAQIGFDGIQLSESGGRAVGFPLTHPEIIAAYKYTAAQHNIQLHSLNLGALLTENTIFYETNTIQGEQARDSLLNGILACTKLGINAMVVTVSPKTKEAYYNAISHLKYAGTIAQNYNIELVIESILSLSDLTQLIEDLNGIAKICMDTLNPLRFGSGNPQEQILAFGKDKIHHFHIKDSISTLFSSNQRGCVPIGTGNGEYKESIAAIKSIGYEGWIISENYYYLPPLCNIQSDFMLAAYEDLRTLQNSF